MSRLKPPELHEMTPEQRRVHDKVVGQAERGALVGPFRAALILRSFAAWPCPYSRPGTCKLK